MGAGASASCPSNRRPPSGSSCRIVETTAVESFPPNEIQCCLETWGQLILISDRISPDPAYKCFSIWFYSLCFKSLCGLIEEQRSLSHLDPLPNPHVLHTIMIFMLKLLSVYLSSSFTASSSPDKPRQNNKFANYSRALARSGSQLGISVTDYASFEKAFVSSIEIAFDAPTALIWTKVWRDILKLLLPEYVEQEAQLGTRRPLRMSGSRAFRESHLSESESLGYYAEYASMLVTSKGDKEDNDPHSVHRRMYTSLHNCLDNDPGIETMMMQSSRSASGPYASQGSNSIE
jgi:hypothetical protein